MLELDKFGRLSSLGRNSDLHQAGLAQWMVVGAAAQVLPARLLVDGFAVAAAAVATPLVGSLAALAAAVAKNLVAAAADASDLVVVGTAAAIDPAVIVADALAIDLLVAAVVFANSVVFRETDPEC